MSEQMERTETYIRRASDRIDQEIDAKLKDGPVCVHCGFNRVRRRSDFCTPCVKRLVKNLVLRDRRQG